MSRRGDVRRPGGSGLALVELLVAMVVLGVVLTAGWRAASAASERQALVRDRIYAQWVAQDSLARLRAQRLWPPVGNREYEATQGGRAFVVREQVTTTPNPSFRQVRLRVHEAGDSGQPLTELVGFVRESADRPAAGPQDSSGRNDVRVGLADAR